MAHFTLSIDPSGGPIISAMIGVSHLRREALVVAEQSVPTDVSIRALVDTGASCSCVDPSVLRSLRLTPTGSVMIHTPSTGSTPHSTDEFDVSLSIPGSFHHHTPLTIPATRVTAAELADMGIQALIGRDVLADCMLVYNGSYG